MSAVWDCGHPFVGRARVCVPYRYGRQENDPVTWANESGVTPEMLEKVLGGETTMYVRAPTDGGKPA